MSQPIPPASVPEKPRNFLLFTLAQRDWQVFVVTILLVWAARTEWVFQRMEAFIFIPAVLMVSASSAVLVLHLIFRDTLDAYIHTGRLVNEFWNLNPWVRVTLTLAIAGLILYCGCIVGASVGR